MCGLCGLLGGTEHWTDPDDRLTSLSSAAERYRRVAVANRLLARFGLKLSPWAHRYTLSNRTGRTEIVDSIGALWPAAERLSGRACDPLDPQLIGAMRGTH